MVLRSDKIPDCLFSNVKLKKKHTYLHNTTFSFQEIPELDPRPVRLRLNPPPKEKRTLIHLTASIVKVSFYY